MMYFPDKKVHYPPEERGLVKEEVHFKSKNGETLHGWFFPASKPKGTVVQFHGNGQNLTAHYLTLTWIVDEGYSVFVFDYQGYGESTGVATPENTYYDGLAALNAGWMLHKRKSNGKFIVYGQSMGVPIALRAAEKDTRIDLVVADSGFLSYKAIFSQTLSRNWLTFIVSWIPYLTVSNEYAPNIENITVPLLVIHDRYDGTVKFNNGEEIFKQAKNSKRKSFWILENGYHIATFFVENKVYRKKFLDYLRSN